jgi:hypothetical protein
MREACGGVSIAWDGVCQLAATGGVLLDVYPNSSASDQDIQLAIAGAGLAVLLHQRGSLVLHGSCVEIAGSSVALVGSSGAGKSTIARALVAAGHGLVSDGMTAVDFSSGLPRVASGVPAFKLWPDAAEALGYQAAALPRVHAQSEKLLCDASSVLVDAPGTLTTIIVLASGNSPRLEPLRPSAAAFELARHFFLSDELGATSAERVLRDCARLAGIVNVARLERAGLAELAAVVALVTGYARSGAAPR